MYMKKQFINTILQSFLYSRFAKHNATIYEKTRSKYPIENPYDEFHFALSIYRLIIYADCPPTMYEAACNKVDIYRTWNIYTKFPTIKTKI